MQNYLIFLNYSKKQSITCTRLWKKLLVNIKMKMKFGVKKGGFIKKQRTGSTAHPFLIKLTNLTKPKLMKINVLQK